MGKVKKEDLGWIFRKIKEFGGEVQKGHREWDVGKLWEEIEKFFFWNGAERDRRGIRGMRRLEGRVTGERDKRWRRRMARWALANLGG